MPRKASKDAAAAAAAAEASKAFLPPAGSVRMPDWAPAWARTLDVEALSARLGLESAQASFRAHVQTAVAQMPAWVKGRDSQVSVQELR